MPVDEETLRKAAQPAEDRSSHTRYSVISTSSVSAGRFLFFLFLACPQGPHRALVPGLDGADNQRRRARARSRGHGHGHAQLHQDRGARRHGLTDAWGRQATYHTTRAAGPPLASACLCTQTDRRHRAERSKGRISLLSTIRPGPILAGPSFPPHGCWLTVTATTGQAPEIGLQRLGPEVPVPTEPAADRFMVRCDKLDLRIDDVEPFFGSMALYDFKVRRLLSPP